MDAGRRGFFNVSLGALVAGAIPATAAAAAKSPQGPKLVPGLTSDDAVHAPAGAVIVEIEGVKYEMYLWHHNEK